MQKYKNDTSCHSRESGNPKMFNCGFRIKCGMTDLLSIFVFLCLYFLFFIFYILFLLFPLSSRAAELQQSIAISPAIFNLKYVPGTSAVKILTVKNQGQEPTIFKISLAPISPRKSDSTFNDLSSWVAFSTPDTIALEPSSERQLKILINIPKYALPQGYYGQIMLEPLIVKPKSSLQIVPVFAIPFLVDVVSFEKISAPSLILQNLELDGKIESQALKFVFNNIFRVPAAHAEGPVVLTEKSPFNFKMTFKNTGKFLHRSSGAVSIYTLDGREIANNEFPEVSLLPGESKTVNVKTDLKSDKLFSFIFPKRLKAVIETPPNPPYFAKGETGGGKRGLPYFAKGETGGGIMGVKDELIFWVVSWKKSLLIAVLILMSLFIFCLKRRIKKSLKILITNQI